jgi:hypothetical protein
MSEASGTRHAETAMTDAEREFARSLYNLVAHTSTQGMDGNRVMGLACSVLVDIVRAVSRPERTEALVRDYGAAMLLHLQQHRSLLPDLRAVPPAEVSAVDDTALQGNELDACEALQEALSAICADHGILPARILSLALMLLVQTARANYGDDALEPMAAIVMRYRGTPIPETQDVPMMGKTH